MTRLTLILIIGILTSCSGGQTSPDKQGIETVDTSDLTQTTTNDQDYTQNQKTKTTFHFKDSTQYSTDWIKEFKERHSGYETVRLINDTIIINNDRKGFITLPTDLPLNEDISYELTKGDKTYRLTVKRINYTTIEYSYSDKNKNKQGVAHIEPVFYFGAEGTFEDDDGVTYGMNEYIDHSEKDCWTYIYIGMGSINKTFLTHGCETDKEKIETPLLTREK